MIKDDFTKFAISNGIGSARLDQYNKSMNCGGYISPTIIEERQLNVAAFDCFSRLMMDRIIFFGTEVVAETANIVNAQLLFLNSTGEEDIKMFINTPGGSIPDGLAVYDTMNFVTPDISTYCMGNAASMGSILLSSGTVGKRYSLPHGEVLLHQPIGGLGYSQASDFEIANKHIQYYKEELYKILAKNTGKDVDQIRQDADRDHWFTAQEALDYGLIDKIIEKA